MAQLLCVLEKNSTMLMLILVTFSLLVIIIGLTTAKLNAKVPCDHNWVETESHDLRCTKCFRVIRHTSDEARSEMKLVQERPIRPEGVRISQQFLRDTDLNDA